MTMTSTSRFSAAGAAAALMTLWLAGCADPLLGPTGRAQGRQCNQLVVPEQREACFRDINGERPATVPRKLESPRPAAAKPDGEAPAERKDDAAARAARRGLPDKPAAAASAAAP